MAFKYVSVDRVIENVFDKQDYTYELDWGRAIEWVGTALKMIGAPKLYIDKTTGLDPLTPNVSIVSYRGELPIDCKSIQGGGVRDATSKTVYRHSSDSFHVAPTYTGEDPYQKTADYTYTVNDNYIFTNKETATLEIAYKAIKIDDRGFPMIPDIERVIAACEAYVTYRVDHILWRKNKLARDVKEDSERQWLWYVGSADTALRIPSVDRRETWAIMSTRLLPLINQQSTSFAHSGTEEDLNIGS